MKTSLRLFLIALLGFPALASLKAEDKKAAAAADRAADQLEIEGVVPDSGIALKPDHARAAKIRAELDPEGILGRNMEMEPDVVDAAKEARLAWWRDARFGCFIHWGAYSAMNGNWQGRDRGDSHLQRQAKIPQDVYRTEVIEKFNPTQFNADEWIKTIKDAGMKYIVITAKHHDGFAMWDSKVSDYNVVKMTPFKRDPLMELKEACKKYGIHFGVYYSQAFDWGEKDGVGNDWEWGRPGGDKGLFGGRNWWIQRPDLAAEVREKYVYGKSIPQIKELLTTYDADVLWFDTGHKLPESDNHLILQAVRKTKPSVVVNSRNSRYFHDYASSTDNPSNFPPEAGDWEAIPTLTDNWGYHSSDHSHKSPERIIHMLVGAAARGGNTLMNIGPTGEGIIDPKSVEVLHGIGVWMKANGESIYGTQKSPLPPQPWGDITMKGDKLYLHVVTWPTDGKLPVGGLRSPVKKVTSLTDPKKEFPFVKQGDSDVIVTLPAKPLDPIDTVLVLEYEGKIKNETSRLLEVAEGSTNELHIYDSQFLNRVNMRYWLAGKEGGDQMSDWKQKTEVVKWTFRIAEKTTFEVQVDYATKSDKLTAKANLAIGKWTAPLSFSPTKDWTKHAYVDAGQVTLEPGKYDVTITPEEMPNGEMAGVRRVLLKPVKAK